METELWYLENDGISGNIYGENIEENLYILTESSLISDKFLYGTKVKVSLKEDKKIWIDEIIEPTNFDTEIRILNKDFIESENFKKLTGKIVGLGGSWDRSMGGVICFYIPKKSNFDLGKEAEKLKDET